ncbi:MAG: hypothetical protein GF353_01430 [Candidatus Lokiarchaeota archaeon]|nr:hypothetical protein [Candidatus Lokiarchaeota archaeon]
MHIIFDTKAEHNSQVKSLVTEFLAKIEILEAEYDMPIIIFQDGVLGSHYIKCSLLATQARQYCDFNARLDFSKTESYRANRELLLKNQTYLKMESDASKGREFNDIIVEYNTSYAEEKPLKIWGGQHRLSAVSKAGLNQNRYHGFRIYFNLSKQQRTEVALISNTNISVSNDTFDRMMEETIFGDTLRNWCQKVGFLNQAEDFPDVGSKSEKITVKKARSFIVNFYMGKEKGSGLESNELDNNIYEPYLTKTGIKIDDQYKSIMTTNNIIQDGALLLAGQKFLLLHKTQQKAVSDKKAKIDDRKAYRNKALVESVLCGWSYIAGVLQSHPDRLNNHYRIPQTNPRVPDPLNADAMSKFKHDSDPPTYRGLGTRSAIKDRQRIAQLFLAKSMNKDVIIDKTFMDEAVSQVVGLQALAKGYMKR